MCAVEPPKVDPPPPPPPPPEKPPTPPRFGERQRDARRARRARTGTSQLTIPRIGGQRDSRSGAGSSRAGLKIG